MEWMLELLIRWGRALRGRHWTGMLFQILTRTHRRRPFVALAQAAMEPGLVKDPVGRTSIPQRKACDQPPTTCPEDGHKLVPTAVKGAMHCETCKGYFMSKGVEISDVEVEVLIARDNLPNGQSRPPMRRPQYRRCPACHQLMARKNFYRVSGILVDQCPDHGTWFDRGELKAAADFLRSGGDEQRASFEENEAHWRDKERETIDRWSKQTRERRRAGRYFFG